MKTIQHGKLTTAYTTITPTIAKAMLRASEGNRTLVQGTVEAYIRDMQSGRFQTTHQGILIGKGNRLIDGHHRLTALTQAGITHVFMTTVDPTLETPKDLPIDSGAPRAMSYLIDQPSRLISVINLAAHLLGFKKLSTTEATAWAAHFRPYYNTLSDGKIMARRGVTNAAVNLAAILLIPQDKNIPYVQHTYRELAYDKFAELPTLPGQFYKRYVVNRSYSTARELFQYAYRALDYDRRDQNKLAPRVPEDAWKQLMERLENFILPIL